MKKKYIIIIIILLVLSICTLVIINTKNNSNNKTNNNKTTNTNITYEQDEIDWSNYNTYELELTESKTISEEGIYHITGKITNGSLNINTDGYVKLILDNISITNNNDPAIYIEKSKTTYIELKNNTENTLIDGENSELDAVIYSKDDLIIEGDGTLNITANNQDGIVSKDDLVINNGNINITSIDDAIKGKDSVVINGGNINITSKGDGIKSTNDTDETKGYILINNGSITINSTLDGIQSENKTIINDGTINIQTTGNSDDLSKGIKSKKQIEINGGNYNINSYDDGIHSNSNIIINGGEFKITSKDDAIHADGLIEINDGTFNMTASEGIEGTYVKINDGDISISASDDGINAGHKSDEYSVKIEINGGNITIKMGQGDTDGIDSNGDLYINGGTIDITANSPFDYDGESKYNGGTIIVNGETTNTITNQMMGGPGMNMNKGMDMNQREPGMNRMNEGGRNIR